LAQSSTWEFDLYIVGGTPKARFAYANLKKFCKEHLNGECMITVYDLILNPKAASDNQITANPTTILRRPLPERTLIGDLSNTESIILKLGLK